jgi:hypothetical protein
MKQPFYLFDSTESDIDELDLKDFIDYNNDKIPSDISAYLMNIDTKRDERSVRGFNPWAGKRSLNDILDLQAFKRRHHFFNPNTLLMRLNKKEIK